MLYGNGEIYEKRQDIDDRNSTPSSQMCLKGATANVQAADYGQRKDRISTHQAQRRLWPLGALA